MADRAKEAAAGDKGGTEPLTRAVALHVLKLPEDPVLPDQDYSRFDMRWLLDKEVNAPAGAELATGDLVQLDQLLTGAGEFEGLRFVGPADADGRRELLLGDVESPVFPRVVAVLAATGPTALRQLFEPALAKVVELQGVSLQDIFGGNAEAFWAEPDVQHREHELAGEWVIKLADCTWVETYRFAEATHGNSQHLTFTGPVHRRGTTDSTGPMGGCLSTGDPVDVSDALAEEAEAAAGGQQVRACPLSPRACAVFASVPCAAADADPARATPASRLTASWRRSTAAAPLHNPSKLLASHSMLAMAPAVCMVAMVTMVTTVTTVTTCTVVSVRRSR